MATTKTRTQRRLEKRQAVILLVLVLVVSLGSFTMGVIVGRRGAERDLASKMSQAEKVLVAEAPAEVTAPIATEERGAAVAETEGGEAVEETKLSFYDNLAKDNAPLGSGINLAPVEKQEAAAKPPIDLPDQPIVVAKAKPVEKPQPVVEKAEPAAAPKAAAETGSALPKSVAGGTHAVQIGSFNSATDAVNLKKKMIDKGYPTFVAEADLGQKGLWYRVRIGPYTSADVAKQVQQQLETREKIKGFVSRR